MFTYAPWLNNKIVGPEQLDAAVADTKLFTAMLFIFLFLLAFIWVSMISTQGGINTTHVIRRRRVYWVLGLVVPALLVTPYIWLVRYKITRAMLVNDYISETILFAVLCLGGYVLLGFILSKTVFRNKAFGTIFSKRSK